jgi:hypothetical protein
VLPGCLHDWLEYREPADGVGRGHYTAVCARRARWRGAAEIRVTAVQMTGSDPAEPVRTVL